MELPIETAVLLAGGAGLRLRPLTDDRPKAMIEVGGGPLLELVIRWLVRNHVRRLVIGIAYRGEMITDHFKEGRSAGLKIQYSTHTVEGGTAEGFRLAIERHIKDQTFFAMNGDELTNVKLQELADFHRREKATATIAVAPLRCPFGVVDLDGHDIVAFREKPTISSVRVSVGVYAFEREILNYLPKTGEIEKTAFARLAAERQLRAFEHNGYWMTVNTIKDLEDVENALAKGEL